MIHRSKGMKNPGLPVSTHLTHNREQPDQSGSTGRLSKLFLLLRHTRSFTYSPLGLKATVSPLDGERSWMREGKIPRRIVKV